MILLTPGPANTTQTVKDALVGEDVCHREQMFSETLASIRTSLLHVAGAAETHDVVLFTGSGTCAVDAAISSCVPRAGRLLVVGNGTYGKRMAQMAAVYGVPHDEMSCTWHEPLDVAAVEQSLSATKYTHLAFVHHETSTGVLNPLREIASLCAERGVSLILDAISSFAGIPVPVNDPPVDVFMASANKCLQGMPGLSFVFVRKSVLAVLRGYPPRSFYTSLALEQTAVEKSGQMRFTPAVQVAFALRQALDEAMAETLEGRFARYRANFDVLVEGMQAEGFRKLLPDEHESGLLTSWHKPTVLHYDFDRHHDLLLERGFVIYPAKAGYEHTFRLGNIGAISSVEIRQFLAANVGVLAEMEVEKPLYGA